MSPGCLEHLLSLVGPSIKKTDTFFRKAIEPAQRLALTLRFLASGDSQQSLTFSFRISSRIISEESLAIWEKLSEYTRPPKSEIEWLRIADEFKNTWNLERCIGAIDGN